jgi:hypothetical protein
LPAHRAECGVDDGVAEGRALGFQGGHGGAKLIAIGI